MGRVSRPVLISDIETGLAEARCVALIGPDQVGKSHAAQEIARQRGSASVTLNLSREFDCAAFRDDVGFFAVHGDKLAILDDIHRMPDALETVRSRLEEPPGAGSSGTRFLLLGSNLTIPRMMSDRLSGRLRHVDVNPLQAFEILGAELTPLPETSAPGITASVEPIEPSRGPTQSDLWLRGGFPASLLADSDARSFRWREDYLRSYLNRSFASPNVQIPDGQMDRALREIAADQGGECVLQGRTQVFRACLEHLKSMGLVRELPPWSNNATKRLSRHPKLYIRDSGLLHLLEHLRNPADLVGHGSSWEGFCVEALAQKGQEKGARSYFYREDQIEMDLVLEFAPGRRWAFEIKLGNPPRPQRGFFKACEAIQPERRFIVYPGESSLRLDGGVEAVSLGGALEVLQKAG